MTHSDPRPLENTIASGHLTDDQLLAWIDNDVPTSVRDAEQRHLDSCQQCRDTLADLRAIHQVLRAQPQVAVPRSFQLTPEMAGVRTTKPGGIFGWILPLLPALRASTLVLFLAFASVTGLRIVQDRPDNGQPVAEQGAVLPTATTAQNVIFGAAPPTSTIAADNAADQSQPAPEAAAKESPATEAPGASESESTGGGAFDSAPAATDAGQTSDINMTVAEASPTMTPSPTASVTATATAPPVPTVTATPGPVLTSREPSPSDDSWLPDLQWIIGGIMLASAITLVVGTLGTRKFS